MSSIDAFYDRGDSVTVVSGRILTLASPLLLSLIVGASLVGGHTRSAAILAFIPLAAVLLLGDDSVVVPLRISDRTKAVAAWVILLVAAMPWSDSTLQQLGSVQTSSGTGKAKAAALLVAGVLAFLGRRKVPWNPVLSALCAYAAIATVGGYLAFGADGSSLIRSARYVLLVVAAGWVASRLEVRAMIAVAVGVATSLSLLALVSHGVGLNPYEGNRLIGFWPRIHANELALVASIALLGATAFWAQRQWSGLRAGAVAAVTGVTLILTGSRTGLFAVAVGALLIVVFRWGPRAHVIAVVTAAALILILLLQANTSERPLSNVLTRGGSAQVNSTFTNRTIAWNAIIHQKHDPTTSERLLGQGLSVKTVPVTTSAFGYASGYANVDSAWFSGYLEGGLIGLGALILATVAAFAAAWRIRDPATIALLALIVIASFLGDTLNDADIALVVMVGLASGSILAAKQRADDSSSPRSPTA